ncbi:Aerotaxis receptor [Tepidimonas sediminis]|uniref:Aerotaxis receptor n=1 Tax=Tepidimonas sediminis TaxID=2588941 RepID=A0A554WQN8_9BURK|nr:PAS domain-containing methyl-accepting chemotaxis protein [Tepidimonas sediminis]TSE25873.1 Aerotaxis receptor [Tepidimonas sediminis]
MRINQPVTQREFPFDGRQTLLSTTDPKGRITYANSAFIAVSGFDVAELTGQPHNIVRHPDMPPEAFADMWATIKGGESWTALVKNRRKDGDHYWVRANATPMVRDGQLAGYLSVRTAPTRAEIEAAEALYRRFREGRAQGLAFHKGLIVRTGWQAWRSLPQRLSTAARIRLAVWGTALLPVLVGAVMAMLGGSWAAEGVVAAAAVLAALLADVFLMRQIVVPLRAIRRQAQAVASGSPGENLNLNRVDDIGMVLRAINQSGLNLRALVDDVAQQVGGLGTVAEQIAQGNEDLSARTESNAASLEQTAASMEQLTATVRHNADSAQQASQLATSASSVAAAGGEVVQDVVRTMERITASSQRIEQIVAVIDSIAFQTNILALNAAVEAARAGEAGRGFAVVAGEVRQLAQRSADAAKEIKALIQGSVAEVRGGAELVAQAGARMGEIVEQVRQVTQLVNEISAASAEQSSGVAQVGEAVAQLDQNTQSNAALVEEMAAAARSLHQQAERLGEAVAVWRGGAAAVRAAAVPARWDDTAVNRPLPREAHAAARKAA